MFVPAATSAGLTRVYSRAAYSTHVHGGDQALSSNAGDTAARDRKECLPPGRLLYYSSPFLSLILGGKRLSVALLPLQLNLIPEFQHRL